MKMPWRQEQLPRPVFWLGEFRGQGGLAGCSPWGQKESDTTERLNSNHNRGYSEGHVAGFKQVPGASEWTGGGWEGSEALGVPKGVKEESEKVGLKLSVQKGKIMVSDAITS